MAPKTHRTGATGLPRTHSRSSSGGSSKAALNLHFTQRDSVIHKQQDKPKRNGHVFESQTRNGAQYSRPYNSTRVPSKEHLLAQAQRHAPSANQGQQNNRGKNFTLASSSADEDDEWVSSESGAATPNSPDSGSARSQTPVDQRTNVSSSDNTIDELSYRPDTPRAQGVPPSLSRVPTIRASESQDRALSPTTGASPSRAPLHCLPQAVPIENQTELALHPQLPITGPRAMGTRSETTSPVHRAPYKRSASTRPPSMHTVTGRSDVALHPHPLIRGQSFGPVAPRLEPLAPLTVTSEVSSVQTSSSPTLSTSPSSIEPTHADTSTNRRTSISSVRSVATLPSQGYQLGKGPDRNRTLSSMSSSSSTSVQALASLAHLPTTRPPTPQYTAHFPPASLSVYLEVVHPLLPPPYLNAHMSILTHRSPLKESYDRVLAARELQQPRFE